MIDTPARSLVLLLVDTGVKREYVGCGLLVPLDEVRTVRDGLPALEPDFHVGSGGHVNAIDESDSVRCILHQDRMSARAIAEKPHATHQRAISDARGSEDDLFAGGEIPGTIDPLEIRNPHRPAPLFMLGLADHQARKNLAVQAPHSRGT